MPSERSAIFAGLGMLAASVGAEMSQERMKLYAEDLADLDSESVVAGLVALRKSFQPKFNGHMPSVAEIREAALGVSARVACDVESAETFRQLMWAYSDCVDGKYGYDMNDVERRFGLRAAAALWAIGGGAKMDLARYDETERKWALKEFQDAMRGLVNRSGVKLLLDGAARSAGHQRLAGEPKRIGGAS